MERTTIILLCVAFIIVWMLVKRLVKRPKLHSAKDTSVKQDQHFDLDKWFGQAQDMIGLMASDQREKLEAEWRDMEADEQLVLANEFLQRSATAGEQTGLSSDERLKVGWARFVSGLDS